MYAKFINENQIEEAPINKCGVFNYNLDALAMVADGYKLVTPLPNYPVEMRQPSIRYRALDDSIEAYYVEPILGYAEKRAAEYPDMAEYLDAQVKINSGVEELVAEGQEQLIKYYTNCLEIKAKYPKTSNIAEA